MRIFVLDISMDRGAVGIIDSNEVVSEFHFEIKRGSTNTAHFYIKKAFANCGITPREVDLIGVVIGPGSFTGLRVALSAAKGLAHPFSTSLTGIISTEAVAEMVEEENVFIVSVIDARRLQFYRGVYMRENGELSIKSEPAAINEERIFDGIPAGSIITGPGLKKIEVKHLNPYKMAPEDKWYPSVAVLSKIAEKQYSCGDTLDLADSVPYYIRRPDAKPNPPLGKG